MKPRLKSTTWNILSRVGTGWVFFGRAKHERKRRKSTGVRLAHRWKGPIVAMRQPGTETDPLMCEHITLADLNIFVDYFTSYDHESAQDLEIRGFNFGSEAKRVRINCESDQRFGVDKYAAVARDHMVQYSWQTRDL